MTVTIHTGPNARDLHELIRDLQLLDGGPGHRIRRAIHGSGAIVEDDLALAWLTLTGAPSPEFLESLMRQDPRLEDLIGRRASDAALHELWLYLNEVEVVEAEAETIDPTGVKAAPILPPPVKASAAAWKEWAVKIQLLTPDQAETTTKAQIQQLAEEVATSGQSAPEQTEEG